ncbi:MAG: MFS transporter [Desulfovibrionaceae bacterium]|nr:MFS transporter [Desulfovibrionaceae bacterium]
MGPGLVYGLITSRMPAMKAQTGAHEAEIGYVLLAFGLSALVGLTVSSSLIRRFSSRRVLQVCCLGMLLVLPLTGSMQTPLTFGLASVLMGIFMGFVDVAMNAQAIQLEQRFAAPCLALMHGTYSLGGLLGALSGALFSSFGISPFLHFCAVMALYAVLLPRVMPRLQRDRVITSREEEAERSRRHRLSMPPLLVMLFGVLAACCYAAEGTVGEWGALYLFTVKGAGEETAALVYACFAVTTLCCRMTADMARTHFSDFTLALTGALLAVIGMSTVLAADAVALCLLGYACMGFGMAPLVPLCFSRAGQIPGVSPSEASAVVSVMGYGGLLMFPPIIGNVAHAFGLGKALYIALGLVLIIAAGSALFRCGRRAAS